jgi:hypothetical protein
MSGWTVNDDYTAGYDKALADLAPEIERLRAENEKLRLMLDDNKQQLMNLTEHYEIVLKENERLRAKLDLANKRLCNPELTWAENDRLRAELAEWNELKKYAKSLGQKTYLELHAANERLRDEVAYLRGGK